MAASWDGGLCVGSNILFCSNYKSPQRPSVSLVICSHPLIPFALILNSMAESFVFDIAENVLGKLGSVALREIRLARGVKSELAKLKDTLLTIKVVLLDAEEQQRTNDRVSIWLRKLETIFYDADDVFDEFGYEALQQEVACRGTTMEKVCHFFSLSNPLIFYFRMAHKIKDIRERMNTVAVEKSQFDLVEGDIDRRVGHRERETYSFLDTSYVIGRENDKEIIIDLLMQSKDHASISVIPIVGIGGLGKTTLAKMVYHDERVINHFDLRKWVCVSEDFNIKLLIQNIANLEPGTKYENLNMESLVTHAQNALNGKRYLLILDDVWNEDSSKWMELRSLLVGSAYGSNIIVTTRSQKVASIVGTTSHYNLEGLSNEDCLFLFIKYAFAEGQDKQCPNLVEIGKDIVKKCGKTPLAIRTLGSLLYMNTEEHEWFFVRDNDIWNLEQREGDILNALKLSYDQLPSHLKRCFASCSIFPKGYEFNSNRLICLWMAQGLIQSTDQNLDLEDIGRMYFTELQSRSFFENVSDHGFYYSFKMHDLMHDLALLVTQNEISILNSDSQNISQNVRHVSFYNINLMEKVPKFVLQLKSLRSILLPNLNKSFADTCISRFKCLRVLDLQGCQFEVLPTSIGDLKHLRLLDLSGNYRLASLPNSFCKLLNLQTLELSACEELKELPRNIRNLISLRCMSLTTQETHLSEEGVGSLTSLRFLGIANCFNIEFLLHNDGMQHLSALQTLSISCCFNLVSLPRSLRNLTALENLVILDCQKLDLMMDDQGREKGAQLRGGLRSLRLLWISWVPKLVSLPHWLQGASNTLKHIMIKSCPNFTTLPEWMQDLKVLQKLEISGCSRLTSLPEGMNGLISLREIHILYRPQLIRRCQREIGEDWHKISHVPNIYLNNIKI